MIKNIHFLFIFSLFSFLLLQTGCSRYEPYKIIDTEKGSYVISEDSGQFYKYQD